MTASIVAAIVSFLTGLQLEAKGGGHLGFDSWFFQNSLAASHPHLETTLHLRHPMIGIGAPADIFLPPVASALNTELILPEHYEVANAVGAVGGSVMVEEEILVYPQLSGEGLDVVGYYVLDGESRQFEQLQEALSTARARGQERALAGALRAGAEDPQVLVEEMEDGLDSYRLRVRAFGNPRLSR